MKRIFIFLSLMASLLSLNSCDEQGNLVLPGLTEAEIVDGLKTALRVGTDSSVTRLNKLNGYFGDQAIKILLPPEAGQVLDLISYVPGGNALVNEVILKMNRGAEQAAAEAKPIFVGAITGMTFSDARNILFAKDAAGNKVDSAATNYLRRTTNDSLYTLFRPKISSALNSVGADVAWNTLFTRWNAFANSPGGALVSARPVNADLNDYATRRALNGLFVKIRDKEKDIRENPAERVTDILKKVFGELDKQ
jgi:hypothetical protein